MSTAALAARCVAILLAFSSDLAFCEAPVDPTFALGAPYPIQFGSDGAAAAAIARDSVGHLVTATTAFPPSSSKQAVTRHTNAEDPYFEGILDRDFASNGIATDFFGAGTSDARAIAIDHQDRIVIGGTATAVIACEGGINRVVTVYSLVRLKNRGDSADGQGDWTFGNFGEAIYGDCDHNTEGLARLVVDGDDSVVAIGDTIRGSHEIATLIRWTSEGTIDPTFGIAGIQTINYGTDDTYGVAVALDSTGRIIVAFGTTVGGVIGRYKSNGSLDTTFGDSGFAQVGALGDLGYLCCTAVDEQDRVLIAGTMGPDLSKDTGRMSAFVMRLREDGIADESFGTHGLAHPYGGLVTSALGLTLDKKIDRSLSDQLRLTTPPTTLQLSSISIWMEARTSPLVQMELIRQKSGSQTHSVHRCLSTRKAGRQRL
jgi:uncharacterized delta-60 repeat protein